MQSEAYYLDITLLGKEYRVACPPEEHQGLLASVAYVDEKMRDIAEKTKSNIAERVAVMAALNIAHEYLAGRKLTGGTADGQVEISGEKSGELGRAMGGKMGRKTQSDSGLDFDAVTCRISAMEAQLDAVLAPQDTQLF